MKGVENVESALGNVPGTGKDCRYALLEYEYTTDDGRPQSKLCFVLWSPDDKLLGHVKSCTFPGAYRNADIFSC